MRHSFVVVGGVVSALGIEGASAEFAIDESIDPLVFVGRHPKELLAKDLYRENGFLGWRRIEASPEPRTEAYAPVAGDAQVKASVYHYDQASGAVIAVFRLLAVVPTDFKKVVDALAAKLQAEPRYASEGAVLRAM